MTEIIAEEPLPLKDAVPQDYGLFDSPELRGMKAVIDRLAIGQLWIQYGARERPAISTNCTNKIISTNVIDQQQTQFDHQPVFGFEPHGPRLRLPGDPIVEELENYHGELSVKMAVIRFRVKSKECITK